MSKTSPKAVTVKQSKPMESRHINKWYNKDKYCIKIKTKTIIINPKVCSSQELKSSQAKKTYSSNCHTGLWLIL